MPSPQPPREENPIHEIVHTPPPHCNYSGDHARYSHISHPLKLPYTGIIHSLIKHYFYNHTLYVCVCACAQSCPTLCNPMDCSLQGSSVHGIFPGKTTGVGCHFLLQGLSLTHQLKWCLLHLLHWQVDSLLRGHLATN